jgi:hypothetical protein
MIEAAVNDAMARGWGYVALTGASPIERNVYEVLREFAFFEPTCHPSQELIARKVGVSREWVNKAIAGLRDLALISVGKARFRGSRWDHNVYVLHGPWHRPHRRPMLTWLRLEEVRCRVRSVAVIDALKRRVHTKGRTSASKGSTERSSSSRRERLTGEFEGSRVSRSTYKRTPPGSKPQSGALRNRSDPAAWRESKSPALLLVPRRGEHR